MCSVNAVEGVWESLNLRALDPPLNNRFTFCITIVAVNHGPTVQSSATNLLYDTERERDIIHNFYYRVWC